MQHGYLVKTLHRAALGAALAATATSSYGCGTSGKVNVDVDIKPPLGGHIKIKFKFEFGQGTFELDAGPAHAEECVMMTWLDANGTPIAMHLVQTNSQGVATGPVPSGAVDWEAKTTKCPPPAEDHGGDSSGPLHEGDIGLQGGSGAAVGQRYALPWGTKDFYVTGGPVVPSEALGADNLTYSFLVRASTFEQVDELIQPILAGGPGTPVPPSVTVYALTTAKAEVAGGRLVFAMPGKFQGFTLSVNDGAFYADLQSGANVLKYAVGDWEVVETLIPTGSLDLGFVPGVTYSNHGNATYWTDHLPGPVTAGYELSFAN